MGEYVVSARYGLLRKFLVCLVAIIPAISLTGWIFNLPRLYTFFTDLTPINPLTAVFFICSGVVADFLFKHQDSSKFTTRQKIILQVFAYILIVVGIVVILRAIFGFSIYPDTLPNNLRPFTQLMSMNTAICFTLLGVIIVSLVWGKPVKYGVVRMSAAIMLSIAVTALAGYIVNQPALYSLGVFSPISLWASILFTLISCCILQLEYKNADLNKSILLSIVVMLTVTVGGMSFMFKSIDQQRDIQSRFTELDAVTMNVNGALTTVLSVETDVREYLMSGDDKYLESYNNAQQQYDASLRDLAAVMDDDITTFNTLKGLIIKTTTILRL